jgi:hypothetical protein
MRTLKAPTIAAMALAICAACATGAAWAGPQAKKPPQTKGAQQTKAAPQTKTAQPAPPPETGILIKDVQSEIVYPNNKYDGYKGFHSGEQYGFSTTGRYNTAESRQKNEYTSFHLPATTEWSFRTKIDGHVVPVEFKLVSSETNSWSGQTTSLWKFTPVEEGPYEIVATATYKGESGAADPKRFTILPKRDWTAPISVLCNGGIALDGRLSAKAGRDGRYDGYWDWPETAAHLHGPICREWKTKSAAGSFLDKGGDINDARITNGNINRITLDPGKMPPGTYSLSIPCEQEGEGGKVSTVTHKFTVVVPGAETKAATPAAPIAPTPPSTPIAPDDDDDDDDDVN